MKFQVAMQPRKEKWIKRFLVPVIALLFFITGIWPSFAKVNADFDQANAYYKNGDFLHAITLYKKITGSGIESPEVYFNLGNCYFKSDSIAKAILFYEKAKKLAPTDEDILFNLKVADQRITDKINPVPVLFIYSWWQAFRSSKTADEWAWLSVTCVFISFMLFATFLIFRASSFKKMGFWGGSFFIVLALITFFLANAQYKLASEKSEAVIMVDAVSVKSSPGSQGKDIFILHAGSKLSVINTEGDWSEIRIQDNSVGWVPTSTIEFI